MPPQSQSSDILVVDADSAQTLASLLIQAGYKVKTTHGLRVLEATKAEKPDLILLNVASSKVSGYEVCQQLKASDATRDIPVIFLVESIDFLNKSTAFAVGGADYISQPFQAEEVLVRIHNQLMLYRQRQQLISQNLALRQIEKKYRSIFDNAAEGIFQTTIDGRYLSVNPTLARIYGYDSPADLITHVKDIGKHLYVQPKRRDELGAYLQQYTMITEAESEVYQKDRTIIWVRENIWTVLDEVGKFLYYEGTVQDITDRRQMETELRQQRLRSERLLVNILPNKIAQRLKASSQTIADSFDEVSVLFADLVDFTAASAQIPPHHLVNLLNQIFSAFDQLAEQHGLEKIKTIGDAYMVAAGIPVPRPDHIRAIAHMALDMQKIIPRFLKPDGTPFQLRIGISTGPVVAGVIGIRKFTYDLWGDTVNLASWMESTGEPGRIQVTPELYDRLKRQFVFEQRGTTQIKGRGEMMTYWLVGSH